MLNICTDKGKKKCTRSECTQTNKTLIIFSCPKDMVLGLSVKVSHHFPQGKQHFAFKLPISKQRHLCQ